MRNGVRTDLDPPRVLGYLLPSRSRRELRADRILAIEPISPGELGPDGVPQRPEIHVRIPSNRTSSTRRSLAVRLGGLQTATFLASCSSMIGPESAARRRPRNGSPALDQEFQAADVENARDAVSRALTIVPTDTEARLLAGRIALARLDYAEALRLLRGVAGSEAAGLRGRALWYKGDLDAAAGELEAMLDDPDVVDEWAKSIAKLARRGAGRAPFTVSRRAPRGLIEMQHVSPTAPFFVVPLEIDGERSRRSRWCRPARARWSSTAARARAELGLPPLRQEARDQRH